MAVVWKKLMPILVLVVFKSVCAQVNNDTGNKQSSGGNSGQPINVNVYTNKECNVKGAKGDKGDPGTPCNCSLQKKPSAHIEGPSAKLFKYDSSSDSCPVAPEADLTGTHCIKGRPNDIISPQSFITFEEQINIKTWTATAPNAHVTGGMTYGDGKLTIPSPGFYYVYAQAYFSDGAKKYKRIFVLRNGQAISLTQPDWSSSMAGTSYTGGVFNLQAGDVISVRVMASNTGIHMDPAHTFFGAFMI